MMLPIELTRPWLMLVTLPMLVVVIYYFVRSLSDFPKAQRILSLSVRSIIALLLVLSLAGLTWLHRTQEQFVIFVADQSQSIGDDAATKATEFMTKAVEYQANHRVTYLPFAAAVGEVRETPIAYGAEPSILRDSEEASQSTQVKAESSRIPTLAVLPKRDGTHLASAIETAAGYMPPGYVPHIVVLSDGNETLGDAVAAAARSHIRVSTVPLPTRSEPEVQVSQVNVPAEVREGEPFFVEVTIQSNHDDEGLVEVFRGDHKVIGESRALKSGPNVFRFQQSIDRDRLAAFTVRVSGLKQDTLLDNNSDTGLVYAAGKPRVLIIESDPNLIRELAYALEDEGIQVDIRPPQGMPESLADLQNYELLMLSNVPATSITQQQMEIARTYVQELGGGFIMLGGELSFGLGGYYKTTLEEILPVRSDFEKEKEKPSLAMVLVIDKSGSMSGDKIEMAKSASQAAVELLGRRDQAAVIAFDGDTYLISDMQSASNKVKLNDEISRIDAGGGTTMYPAMEMSYEMLMSASAKLKHVILLTDGVSSPGDFEGLAQTMASAKMTVSTVAIGDGSATDLLEAIARTGKGRYYLTNDPSQVPQIFAKETVTASKSAIDEQPFVPVVIRATHALAELDFDSAPFLLGYVMTRPKPTCEVILATEKGDPLLAWWRYGLGMTAAFTSDAKSRWSAEWLTWPGYGKFWTQVIRQTMRKSDARGIQVATARHGQQARISVDAVSETGAYLNQSEVELTLINPQLKRQTTTLFQTAPGRYAADFKTPQSGSYHMEIALKQSGQILYRQSRGLMVGYSDELRIQPTNEKLLREMATVSGGTYAIEPAKLFDDRGDWTTRPTPLWPWLLTVACFLLVLDVALRRIDFSIYF
ncbi:MAG: VWA domain-containing protein [Pirellulaceae bacterium]|nr:VWA domain-containing protein [Pirellulaceae bacterium]